MKTSLGQFASVFSCLVFASSASAAFYTDMDSSGSALVGLSSNAVAGPPMAYVPDPPMPDPPPVPNTTETADALTVNYRAHSDSRFRFDGYRYDEDGFEEQYFIESPLSGLLSITYQKSYSLLDDSHVIEVSLDGLSMVPNSFFNNTFELMISTDALLAGRIEFGLSGDPLQQSFGNASFALGGVGPVHLVCVECGFRFNINFGYVNYLVDGDIADLVYNPYLASNRILAGYDESNPYTSGAESFNFYIDAAVPLPSAAWMFMSAFAGLAFLKRPVGERQPDKPKLGWAC